MPRVKRGTVRRAKRKKLEKLTKGYFQNKSKLYKFMKEAADKAGVYAYAGRKQKKRDYRSLWVMRINAAARQHGRGVSTHCGRSQPASGDQPARHLDGVQLTGEECPRDDDCTSRHREVEEAPEGKG